MPCNDITEVIVLHLDAQDRLSSYTLNKRTCGAEIGAASLLLPWLHAHDAAAILSMQPNDVWQPGAVDAADEFLYMKHLAAIQEALRVLTGSAGGPGSFCTATAIHADADAVIFEGLIAVDMLAGKIKSCGQCGSCGSHTPKSAVAATPAGT